MSEFKNQLAFKLLNLEQFGFVWPSCLQKPHFRLARWRSGASDPELFVRFCFDVPAELDELFLPEEFVLVLLAVKKCYKTKLGSIFIWVIHW